MALCWVTCGGWTALAWHGSSWTAISSLQLWASEPAPHAHRRRLHPAQGQPLRCPPTAAGSGSWVAAWTAGAAAMHCTGDRPGRSGRFWAAGRQMCSCTPACPYLLRAGSIARAGSISDCSTGREWMPPSPGPSNPVHSELAAPCGSCAGRWATTAWLLVGSRAYAPACLSCASQPCHGMHRPLPGCGWRHHLHG